MEKTVKKFSSFEEANAYEHRRLASMTPQQRWAEFAILQERAFGKKWTEEPMKKIVRTEIVNWWR